MHAQCQKWSYHSSRISSGIITSLGKNPLCNTMKSHLNKSTLWIYYSSIPRVLLLWHSSSTKWNAHMWKRRQEQNIYSHENRLHLGRKTNLQLSWWGLRNLKICAQLICQPSSAPLIHPYRTSLVFCRNFLWAKMEDHPPNLKKFKPLLHFLIHAFILNRNRMSESPKAAL